MGQAYGLDAADPSDPPDPDSAGEQQQAEGLAEPEGYEDGAELRMRGRAGVPQGEPEGFEDAAAMSRARASASTPGVQRGPAYGAPEPAGAEDLPDLMRLGLLPPHPRPVARTAASRPACRELRYGAGAAAAPAPSLDPVLAPAPTPGISGAPAGKDGEYSEDDGGDRELPIDFAAAASMADGAPLPPTIDEKFQIVAQVAPFESGAARYGAIAADAEFRDPLHPFFNRRHLGLAFGLVQFTQAGGALGRVLGACARRDQAKFRAAFGPDADELLRVTALATEERRLAPVGGARLWEEPWLSRFTAAADLAELRAAQNEVAIEDYLDRNLPFAGWLGLVTDRALAMMYDRVVNMGNGGGRRWLLGAISPIRVRAQRDAALGALGFPDLAAFQRSVPGIEPTGVWGTATHAALIGALRDLGEAAPFEVAALPELLDRLVSAARGRRFEMRVAGLRASTAFHDTVYQVP